VNKTAWIVAIVVYGGILLAAAYLTLAQKVSTPPIVKRSIREGSVGHVPLHRGIRHGK
jgi:hypothetical protein